MSIGERIKKLRKIKKMTLEQLGEKIGLKKSTISLYEKNEINIPTDKLEKIAIALDTTPTYLMGFDKQIEDETYVDISMLNNEQIEELELILATNNVMFFKGNKQRETNNDILKASITRAYLEILRKK